MTLKQHVTKNIVHKLLSGNDYRIEIVNLIDAEYLQYSVRFLHEVAEAKRDNPNSDDWYKRTFLNHDLPTDEIIINSGLNKKTITNMYNSAARNIVEGVTDLHYDSLTQNIANLIEATPRFDMKLTVSSNRENTELNAHESLVVLNTLAVKRAQLRGGLWSTAGKQAEKPLMLTLCELFKIESKYFRVKTEGGQNTTDYDREIDFFFVDNKAIEQKVEVKLMGQGNPESADAVIARHSKVFAGDSLSDSNIKQFNTLGIKWIELRSKNRFDQFKNIMKDFGIPYSDYTPTNNDILRSINLVFDRAMEK